MSTGRRAIIWAAVSTTAQAADDKASLPAQLADARAWCNQEGFQIVEELVIPGFSRRYYNLYEFSDALRKETANEAGFKLLRLIQERGFDVLVTRDADRLGREQSLVSEVIARVIDAGATIYTFNEGWIDAAQYRMVSAFSGYRAATYVDDLARKIKLGMRGRAERGLPVSGKPFYGHKLIRNQRTGKAIRVEVDEAKRAEWDALADVLIEGTPYRLIETVMHERYGFSAPDGQQHAPFHYRQMLFTPTFWGHAARYKAGAYRGAWAWREGSEPPEGVEVVWNAYPPIYTGAQADQVKAELERRTTLQGRSSPRSEYWFTGLLMCGVCGYRMSVKGRGTPVAMCYSRYEPLRQHICEEANVLNESTIRTHINKLLINMLEAGEPRAFVDARMIEAAAFENHVSALQARHDKLEKELRRAIDLQIKADEDLRQIYDDKIYALMLQRKEAAQQVKQARRQAQRLAASPAQQASFDEIARISLGDFWKLAPNKINQLLFALLEPYRLVAREGKIEGVAVSPFIYRTRRY
jgi:DNA invertase Pin-like site-specific DNA recombinase